MQDSYGREITYLRLAVTEDCNLRCRYCMPEDGMESCRDKMLSTEEMIMAVETAASLGIRKLRLTGGEPLVNPDILEICEKAKAVPGIKELCITTNATMLKKLSKDLARAGVDRLNISIDSLDPEKYRWITRIGTVDTALKGIEVALDAGFKKIKLNSVLIGGFNDDEIADLAALTRRWPVDVRFIELMPMSGNLEFGEEAYIPSSTVLKALPELEACPDAGGDGVARLYRLPGAQGYVGLISPIESHFCGSCNRLRLTADGNLKPCLHSAAEYPIKGLDRQGMEDQFRAAIMGKPQWHGVLSYKERSRTPRPMKKIGG